MIRFSEEQLAIRAMVRDLAREKIAPRAKEWDERGQFPDELRRLLVEHELFVMYLPETLGGLGFDLTTQCLVLEEIAKVDGSAAMTLQDQGTSSHFLLTACTPEQRQRLPPRIRAERLLVAYCLSEPGSGSDAGGLETRARREGDEYVLFASDTAMRVTTDAVQILGGAGYVTEHPVERMMRDAKVTQIFEGTNQIQRLIIARHILK